MRAIAVLAYLAAASVAASASIPAADGPAPREVIDRFFAHVSPPLSSYRAVRHLTASARGGRMQASLTAKTWLDATQGFGYDVVDAGGSSMMQKKVLIAALEAERQMHVNGTGPRGALTPDNYDFTPSTRIDSSRIDPAHTDPTLVRIDLRARRRDTMLIDGAMFLSSDNGDLVRVEGVLVRRPSFWTRRVSVVRRYARVAGVRAPVAMESTAQVLIVGAASFAMTYDYEMVNGAPVHR